MLQPMPVNTALWALCGFYLSLGPTLARVVMGNNAPMVGGAIISALVLTSAVANMVVRAGPARRATLTGTMALVVGLVITLAFSLPAIIAGLAVGSFGLPATAKGFELALLAPGLTALALLVQRPQLVR